MRLHLCLFVFCHVLSVNALSPISEQDLRSSLKPRDHSSRPQHHEVVQKTGLSHSQSFPLRRDSDSNDDAPSAAAEGGHGGRRTIPTTPEQRRTFRIAHGTVMGTAFTIVLPLGAIFLRALPSRYRVVVHASTQLFAYALIIAGMGLGIWLGLYVRYLDYAHTVIGLVAISMLAVQAGLGAWGHARFGGKGRSGGAGLVHVWLGRTLLALGIINGGIGLMLAGNTTGGEIAYGVIAGVMGSIYVAVIVWWINGRIAEVRKQGPGDQVSETGMSSP
ncbi:hypothetical protein MMC25_005269 [Agyrium rufum]|nr:hypothetical protein [Agyrium rufum]